MLRDIVPRLNVSLESKQVLRLIQLKKKRTTEKYRLRDVCFFKNTFSRYTSKTFRIAEIDFIYCLSCSSENFYRTRYCKYFRESPNNKK